MTYKRPPLLARYRNGNYTVRLYADGTKIKHSEDDFFSADFPDSIDLKITDFCDMNCPMCHESSSRGGTHGDLCAPFSDTLRAGTELAIGGGNALSHPDLDAFLTRMRSRGVVCNLTVNERHFLRDMPRLQSLLDAELVHGLGISISDCAEKTIEFARQNRNVILHLICGVAAGETFERLADKGLKILLLGYKRFGRGAAYYSADVEKRLAWTEQNISAYFKRFDAVCFDNAALAQLKVKDKIAPSLYDERYMGDDGAASMYIDLVRGEFARSSTSETRYPIESDIERMFKKIER